MNDSTPVNFSKEFRFPPDLYYNRNTHLWIEEIAETGLLRLGLDALNVESYGDLVYILLPVAGAHLDRGQPIGTLEAAKMVGSLVSPASGSVVEVNPKVLADPSQINQDCYGEGWLLLLRPDDWPGEASGLVHGPEVEQWAENEVKKYREQDLATWVTGD